MQPRQNPYRPLPPRRVYVRRLLRGAGFAAMLLGLGLGIGVIGFRWFGDLPWLDALLNAAMLLGGEGPVDPMRTAAGKVFASFYALFGGILFITTAGVLLSPLVQRFLHRFHREARYPLEPPGHDESGGSG